MSKSLPTSTQDGHKADKKQKEVLDTFETKNPLFFLYLGLERCKK